MNEAKYRDEAMSIRPQLKELVLKDIAAKSASPTFIKDDGSIVVFPKTKATASQLERYKQAIVDWSINPDPNLHINGSDGQGYSLMMTEVLKNIYSGDKNIVVLQTPATFDFVDKDNIVEWGASADIMIGRMVGEHFCPALFIDCKMGRMKNSMRTNRKFNIPVVPLTGRKLFGNAINAVHEFALSESPKKYAAKLAELVGQTIIGKLETV